ncbi:pentatricopeptide repeat-containing protein At1g61870, mitochondrial-like [Neltuma alba]|uniref:pentatricopeptide repeat-containing protein At1g61870, mitochondrial-like n=1 Tax=Neltuma alba TaxID=207710 RepID=UPI0010A3617F|nr:pentatricopeptide repeat-containing protein At1g61870, mitochondrial-like [Prosopis alba]
MFLASRFRQAYRYRFYCTIASTANSSEAGTGQSTWPGPFSPSSRVESRPVLARLKAEENPERILEICRSASLNPEAYIDRICFSITVSKLTAAKQFESIRQLLEELKTRPDFNENDGFACHVIIWYGQANMLEDAILTFKQLDQLGITRSVKSLYALLVACQMAKNYDELCRIFCEFPKTYGIEPNLETYNMGIKAFCIAGKSSSAYSILTEMDRKGVKPDEATFGNLLAGFYNEEKLEDVGKVLQLMVQYGIKPGLTTYNIRIQSLCKMKKSSEAKALLGGMMSRGVQPNTATYCHLIHGFCKEGRFNKAIKLFGDMRTKGMKPTATCHFTLITFLCEGEHFVKAFWATKRCIKHGWIPPYSVMTRLANGLISISKFDDAKFLIKHIKQKFKINNAQWDEIEAKLPS